MNQRFKPSARLSFGEEIANSVTHGIGALVLLVLLPISAIYTHAHYGVLSAVGVSIFIISLFLMFLSSTIYHSMSYGSIHKSVLRLIDHSMIYIAIAGSYTPVILTVMTTWWGYLLLALQWGVTIFGILYKLFAKTVNERFSLILYILMGWVVVMVFPYLMKATSPTFLWLMLAGGLAYTIGALFYAKKRPYFHMIWHLFILLASGLQYVAIVFFILK